LTTVIPQFAGEDWIKPLPHDGCNLRRIQLRQKALGRWMVDQFGDSEVRF
jgi:hypothetical protein